LVAVVINAKEDCKFIYVPHKLLKFLHSESNKYEYTTINPTSRDSKVLEITLIKGRS